MKKILQNNLMFLFTSVFCSATQNIITQMIFEKNYLDKKDILMPLALFLGSIACFLGIYISDKIKQKRNIIMISFIILTILSFVLMILTSNAFIYIISFIIASFCINFLYNIFDVFLATSANDNKKHVKSLLIYQMIGYIVSPLFFSFFISNKVLCILAIVLLSFISYFFVFKDFIRNENSIEEKPKSEKIKVSSNNKLFLSYCFFMYVAIYILLSSMAYLFKDILLIEDYATKSSLFLASVVIISIFVILFVPSKIKQLVLMKYKLYISPFLILLSIILFLVFKSYDILVLGISVLFCSLGYGLFLSDSKKITLVYAESDKMVDNYNLIMTLASLSAYLFSFLIGILCNNTEYNPTFLKLICGSIFFVIAFIILLFVKNPNRYFKEK